MEMFTVDSMCPVCGKFHNNSACHSPPHGDWSVQFSSENIATEVRLSRLEFRLDCIEKKLTEILDKLSSRLDNQVLK